MGKPIKVMLASLAGLAVLIVIVAMGPRHDPDAGKMRPDTAEGRRHFVEIMKGSTGGRGLATEGPSDEGLVFDVVDCMANLPAMLSDKALTDRLDQFDFKWVRCSDNRLKLTPPWK